MEIRREPEKVSDRDIENLDRIYSKKYKKGLLLIAGLLMDVAWFLLIVLIMSFTVYRDISTMNPGMATIALFGAIIVWIVLCILTIMFFIKLPIILHKKIAYRSEFLVEETYMKERVIVGLAYEHGACKRMAYQIALSDKPFLEEMKPFDVVYRYSNKQYPKETDYCVFIKKYF